MPGSAQGTMKISFQRRAEFDVFKQRFLECYANFDASIKGKLDVPEASPSELSYTIGFNLTTGCSSILGDFEKAYNRTFKNGTLTRQEPLDYTQAAELSLRRESAGADYTLELLECALPENFARADVERAETFYSSDSIREAVKATSSADSGDADGLVSFLIAIDDVDEQTSALIEDQLRVLTDLSGVLYAYISTITSASDPRRYDPNLWREAIEHLPLQGPVKNVGLTYNRTIRGVDLALDFLEVIVGGIVGSGSAALSGFQNYIQRLGQAIRAGIDTGLETYQLAMLAIVIEAGEFAGRTRLTPKLKAYFITFNSSSTVITLGPCTSTEDFSIDFSYRELTSVLNHGPLTNPDVAEDFNRFIKNTPTRSIKDADNFFNVGPLEVDRGGASLVRRTVTI